MAKAPGLDIGGQIPVGGADDSHVHSLLLGRTQGAHTALLDRAQQFRLHGQRQVTDLIQEQRAAPSGLEVAVPVLVRAGVRPLARTKELRLEQVFRDGSAIDCDARAIRALAASVQCLSDQLLTGARLTVH